MLKMNLSTDINSQNNYKQSEKINEIIDNINTHDSEIYSGTWADNIAVLLSDYIKVEMQINTATEKLCITGYSITYDGQGSINGFGVAGTQPCIHATIGPSTVTALVIDGSNSITTKVINASDIVDVLIRTV